MTKSLRRLAPGRINSASLVIGIFLRCMGIIKALLASRLWLRRPAGFDPKLAVAPGQPPCLTPCDLHRLSRCPVNCLLGGVSGSIRWPKMCSSFSPRPNFASSRACVPRRPSASRPFSPLRFKHFKRIFHTDNLRARHWVVITATGAKRFAQGNTCGRCSQASQLPKLSNRRHFALSPPEHTLICNPLLNSVHTGTRFAALSIDRCTCDSGGNWVRHGTQESILQHRLMGAERYPKPDAFAPLARS